MKKKDTKNSLMPSGIIDLIDDRAANEFYLTQILINNFIKKGYRLVTPPLIEFEDNFKFAMEDLNLENIFRISDPISNKILYIRNDITPQIARIASTKLKNVKRPIKLTYTGEVLRSHGTQLHPERQLRQAGIELFGDNHEKAAIEVINVGIETLNKANVHNMIIDLTTPNLCDIIMKEAKIDEKNIKKAKSLLKIKDSENLKNIPNCGKLLSKLSQASGEEQKALNILSKIDFSPKGKKLIKKLITICEGIKNNKKDLKITIDPIENRGFNYYSGIGFAIFSSTIKREIGFGGQYFISVNDKKETGMGLSILFDGLLRASNSIKKNTPNK